MRVYISGPIKGITCRNGKAFWNAEVQLRHRGFEVVNPQVLPALSTWSENLRRDIAILMRCDAIYMLRNYRNSKGACLELYIAEQLGMEVRKGGISTWTPHE